MHGVRRQWRINAAFGRSYTDDGRTHRTSTRRPPPWPPLSLYRHAAAVCRADRRLELVLAFRRRQGGADRRGLACARGQSRPHLYLRLADGRRLSVPHRGRLRQGRRAVPQQPASGTVEDHAHPRRRASLRSDAADQRVHRPADHRRAGSRADPDRQLETDAVERARQPRKRRSRCRSCSSGRRSIRSAAAADKTC